jgi:hypothetical protein
MAISVGRTDETFMKQRIDYVRVAPSSHECLELLCHQLSEAARAPC